LIGRAKRFQQARSCYRGKRRNRPPARRKGDLVPTREEHRRSNEIARRIDQDAPDTSTAPTPESAPAAPARLTILGVFVTGATGIATGLATDDLIVIALAVAGAVATTIAAVLFAFASTCGCDEDGCGNHHVQLGWCSEHALAYDSGPDEYRAGPGRT
jgi:hypothetical protein